MGSLFAILVFVRLFRAERLAEENKLFWHVSAEITLFLLSLRVLVDCSTWNNVYDNRLCFGFNGPELVRFLSVTIGCCRLSDMDYLQKKTSYLDIYPWNARCFFLCRFVFWLFCAEQQFWKPTAIEFNSSGSLAFGFVSLSFVIVPRGTMSERNNAVLIYICKKYFAFHLVCVVLIDRSTRNNVYVNQLCFKINGSVLVCLTVLIVFCLVVQHGAFTKNNAVFISIYEKWVAFAYVGLFDRLFHVEQSEIECFCFNCLPGWFAFYI